MKKRITRTIIFFVVAIVMTVALAFSSSALSATGQCGKNVYWSFNQETGELRISGEGEMDDYASVIGENEEIYHTSPFSKNPDIKSVTVEKGVTGIGDEAFFVCDNMTSVTMPDTLTKIGVRSFALCESLDNVVIPDSVTNLDWGAFESCTKLKNIVIPDSVTSIKMWTFRGCESLETIEIPDSVKSIGSYAFNYCINLSDVKIPDSVETIGGWAFSETLIRNIVIPKGMTSIASGAFAYCPLETVTIPGSVMTIGSQAFADCVYLRDVYYYGTKTQWNQISIENYNECLHQATIHYLVCDHAIAAEVGAVAPTCTSNGYEAGVYCDDCETWLSGHETIAKLEHNPIVVNQVEPTCTERGYEGDTVCSTCGALISKGITVYFPRHNFEGSVCKDCGYDRSEECSCNCHEDGIYNVFFKILNFFQKLFGINKVCSCGAKH